MLFVFPLVLVWTCICLSQAKFLSQCGQDEGERNNVLYVSTLDGSLTALDSQGRRQWIHHLSHPLFSSTLSYAKPTTEIPNLIPGLDKYLYQWDGFLLTKLPMTADSLVEEDYVSGATSVRSGARSKEDIGLHLSTGKPLYRCTQHNCEKYDNHSQISQTDLLVVSSHRTTVREATKLTGDELWNFTVAHISLSMVEGELREVEDISCQVEDSSDWTIHTDASQGLLYVTNSVLGTSWNYKFSAPVEGVWMLQGGKLQRIPLSSASSMTLASGPVLMLGVYRNQYYIQPTALLEIPPGIGEVATSSPSPTYLLSLPTPSPALVDPASKAGGEAGKEETEYALALYKEGPNWNLHTYGPKGLAVYFHPWTEPGELDSTCSSGEENSSEDNSATSTPSSSISMETPSSWSQNLELGQTVLKYGVFAIIVLVMNKVRRRQMQNIRRRLSSGENEDEATDNEPIAAVFPGSDHHLVRSSSTSSSATLRPSGSTFLLPIVEEDEDPLPKDHRSQSLESSRFETDYEILGRLGRGGFGVVYHVKNRVDGSEYALKRIKLPVKKFARDKVMREVHALAQLDHPQIVRYFYSWVEQAPPGWDQREEWIPLSRVSSLLQMDEQAGSKPAATPISPTTPLIPNGGCFPVVPSSSPVPSFSSASATHHSGDGATLFSLNELPPVYSPSSESHHSHSSSFTIEFRDESNCRASSDEQVVSQESISNTGSEDNVTANEGSAVTGSRASSVGTWTSENSSLSRHPVCSDGVEPPTFLFIQMQLCQKETLKDWLRNNIYNRQRSMILSTFQQTLSAVLYVHSKGLMHRDLKPSNIFFALDGSVKVGDFGLVTENVSLDSHHHSFLTMKHLSSVEDQFGSSGQRHTGNIGTHFYVSPEQRQGLRYDQKVDIFSLGVILFELNFPFKTEMERSMVLEDMRRGKFPRNFSKHMKQEAKLVEWLISPVERRPTAAEVHSSDQLQQLGDLIKFSDFTYVPTL